MIILQEAARRDGAANGMSESSESARCCGSACVCNRKVVDESHAGHACKPRCRCFIRICSHPETRQTECHTANTSNTTSTENRISGQQGVSGEGSGCDAQQRLAAGDAQHGVAGEGESHTLLAHSSMDDIEGEDMGDGEEDMGLPVCSMGPLLPPMHPVHLAHTEVPLEDIVHTRTNTDGSLEQFLSHIAL